jgi:1,4-alpha-glucan branching enzyme
MTDKTPRKRTPAKKAATPSKPRKATAAKPAVAQQAAPAPLLTTTPPPERVTLPAAPADQIERLVGGTHHDPHSLLGAHPFDGAVAVRALRPGAKSVTVLVGDDRYIADHLHEGVWQATLPLETVPDYRLLVDFGDGFEHLQDDPYRYLPTLGEMDLHLIGEGRHEDLWTVLGSHVRTYDSAVGSVTGTSFAVWAPSAQGVRIAADFNGWGSVAHPMRVLGSTGVWELFVPDVGEGTTYKYDVLGADGVWRSKADPVAFHTEHPPATASVVFSSHHEWRDADWLATRAATDWIAAPMSIYEVHLASWRQGLTYTELAEQLVEYVVDAGFTHVEFLPVAEHPFGGSWGYQVTSYFAPTSRFGSPDEFRHLVDTLHAAGIGVIVDWVPAHFPKDDFALSRFDGTALYEHPDPRRGEQPDWGTYVFNFGRREVRNFLVSNACYWIEEFHIDGLRVDAVASMLYLDYSREDGEWLPNEHGGRENLEAIGFLQEMNATVYKRMPGAMTIAEESTAWPGVSRPTYLGGLGFGFKWNMGWMHDSLDYISHEPVHRQWHHGQLTFSLVYAFSENFVLPISHDEVVHGKGSLLGKMPGDRWQQLANLRAFLAYQWAHPGKQLLFMGCEFGQGSEWSESRSLDWWLLDLPDHRGVHSLVRDLNAAYKSHPALWSQDVSGEGFSWIDANDAEGNVLSFLRWAPDGSSVACVANFSGTPHDRYRLGLPQSGTWHELVNTDALAYTGSGVGNLGSVIAEETPWHGQPASATMVLPPLGVLWLASPAPA